MYSKLKICLAEIAPSQISFLGILSYVVIAVACFFLFVQVDIFHTTASSFAYLNGHIKDFYTYNQVYFVRNDYLPILYSIFAIWNIPLQFFHGLSSVDIVGQNISVLELFWQKVLLSSAYIASAVVLFRITKQQKIATKNAVQVLLVYLSSVPAFFSVFIFSGYDILGVLFTLCAYYFYLRSSLYTCAIFFAIAISFKYFALIIFIPLMLLQQKNIFKLSVLFLIGLSLVALQIGLYWHEEVFRSSFAHLFLEKLASSSSDLGWSIRKYLALICYAALCAYSYFGLQINAADLLRRSVFVVIAAYFLMFFSVLWHPQWIIILMPFFALAWLFIKQKKLLAYIEFIGIASYFIFIAKFWPNNVDLNMFGDGLLRHYLTVPELRLADFYPVISKNVMYAFFMIYLLSPLAIYLFERERPAKFEMMQHDLRSYYVVRFIGGLAFFLVPALIGLALANFRVGV